MICPECLGELVHTSADGGFYWQCAACRGIALGRAEVGRRLGGQFAWYLAEQGRASANVRRWPCPLCSNYLAEIRLPHAGGELVLGHCPACGTAWFNAATCQAWSASPPAVPAAAAASPPASSAAGETASGASGDARVSWPAVARERPLEQSRSPVPQGAPLADQEDRHAPPAAWWQRIAGYFGLPVSYGDRMAARAPAATLTLAAVTVLASLVALYGTDMEVSVRNLAFYPVQAFRHYGLTLLTCFFLHGSLAHLIGNVYALVVFGENVEGRLGGGFFALLVLLATVMGNMIHGSFDPHPQIPLIGASGGIAGLITFCCLSFPRMKVGFYLFYRWRRMPAIVFALIWIVLQGLGAFKQVAGEVGVSYLCHLGGAGVGLLFWLVYRSDGSRMAKDRG